VGREYSEAERAQLARQGRALPDGSYPIPPGDCGALDDAIHAYGGAPDSHRAQLRALIRKANDEDRCGRNLEKLGEV
jgi:hypothetical protein